MYKLSFCRIDILSEKVAEVVFNHNAVVTDVMIEEFLDCVYKSMGNDISLVVDKSTSYTYKYDAMKKLSCSTVIKNLAIVVYDDITESMSEYNKKWFNDFGRNIEIFKTKEDALLWLQRITS